MKGAGITARVFYPPWKRFGATPSNSLKQSIGLKANPRLLLNNSSRIADVSDPELISAK
jgi:hypothetical protein